MAKRAWKYRGEYQKYSKYYAGSESSTAVVKGVGRLAGIDIRSLTASAGNTFTLTLYDNTASGGSIIFSSQNVGPGYQEFPYVEFNTGLFLDIAADTASATATGIHHSVFYVNDQ